MIPADSRPAPLVGFNAAFYTPRKVGINTLIYNVARHLVSSWRLVIYTAYPRDFAQLNAETREIPGWTDRLYTRLVWDYVSLPRLVREDKLALLLSPVPELPLSLPVPSIAVVHDFIPLVLRGSSRLPYKVAFGLSTRLLGAASSLVTVSQHTLSDMNRLGLYADKPKRIIYPGTGYLELTQARDSFPTRVRPGEPFILYVGGFMPNKNVPLLLDAFRKVADETSLRLVLVGWGPERIMKRLYSTLAELRLQDRVTLLRDVDDTVLATLYRHCDLFVYPSRYEGFGSPVLEAMACGAPVVCSNATSLPEVGGDAVVYFSPDSGEELLKTMRTLLGNPELRRELSTKGRMRARSFTWERAAAEYSEVIREALARAR